VKVLLCHGVATVDSSSPADRRTPLYCAVQAADHVYDLVSLLLELKAGVNAKEESGCTPLHKVQARWW
jgi:hypothetical protein